MCAVGRKEKRSVPFLCRPAQLPDSERADCVHYIALSQINLRKYEKAENNLQYLAEKYPDTERAPFAWFYLGLIRLRTGDFTGAEKEFGRFIGAPGVPASFKSTARTFRDRARKARVRAQSGSQVEFGA